MLPLLAMPPGVSEKVSPAAGVPGESVTVVTSPGGGEAGEATAISAPLAALKLPEAMTALVEDKTLNVVAEVNLTFRSWPKSLAGTITVPTASEPLVAALKAPAVTLPRLLPGLAT